MLYGVWCMTKGVWFRVQAAGTWCTVCGAWYEVCDARCMVHGEWGLVRQWCMVCGARCSVWYKIWYIHRMCIMIGIGSENVYNVCTLYNVYVHYTMCMYTIQCDDTFITYIPHV